MVHAIAAHVHPRGSPGVAESKLLDVEQRRARLAGTAHAVEHDDGLSDGTPSVCAPHSACKVPVEVEQHGEAEDEAAPGGAGESDDGWSRSWGRRNRRGGQCQPTSHGRRGNREGGRVAAEVGGPTAFHRRHEVERHVVEGHHGDPVLTTLGAQGERFQRLPLTDTRGVLVGGSQDDGQASRIQGQCQRLRDVVHLPDVLRVVPDGQPTPHEGVPEERGLTRVSG